MARAALAYLLRTDVSPKLIVGKQDKLPAELEQLATRLEQIGTQLVELPDPQQTERTAKRIRQALKQKHRRKDWRKLSHEDVQAFLRFLFGDSTRNAETGIFVEKVGDVRWLVTFRGRVTLEQDVVSVQVRPSTDDKSYSSTPRE